MSAAGNADLLTVELLDKHWPSGQPVLGDIRFAVAAGEVVAISGPSGCGKSTLLAILAGLDHAYRGRVEWAGAPRIGVVFQTPRLLPWRTAAHNVALGLASGVAPGGPPGRGQGGDADPRRRALDMLAEVGLAEAADTYPSRLSLGMAQRVAIARALITEPDVLLLDEAFASLDEEAAGVLRASVMSRVERRRMSVLMVTHDPRDAVEMADRVLVFGGSPTRLVEERRQRRPMREALRPGNVLRPASGLPRAGTGSFRP